MKTIIQALRMFMVLTVLTGIIYPLSMTFAAQIFYHGQAQGSLVMKDGKLIGSELLAQKFESARYFWPRPSAANFATNPSGASNQGPTSTALKETAAKRAQEFRDKNGVSEVPSEMIFASGSGLDPHISPLAAKMQVARVAKARNIEEEAVARIVDASIEAPQFGILGEPRVNIFRLNRALDSL